MELRRSLLDVVGLVPNSYNLCRISHPVPVAVGKAAVDAVMYASMLAMNAVVIPPRMAYKRFFGGNNQP